jgi:hypothetical protein
MRLTRALTVEGIAEGVYHKHENLGATWLAFPRFLEKTKYQTIAEPDTCAFSQSHGNKSIFRGFRTILATRKHSINGWSSNVLLKPGGSTCSPLRRQCAALTTRAAESSSLM